MSNFDNNRPPAGGFPVPFGPVPPAGTKIKRVQARTLPSGARYEIRHFEENYTDADGNLIISDYVEVVPQLADGSQPEDVGEIVECHACQRGISRCNSITCSRCQELFCSRHAWKMDLRERSGALCAGCASPPPVKRAWGEIRDFLLGRR